MKKPKVLLDEQLGKRSLKPELVGDFSVFTVHEMGWLTFKNGLLKEKMNEEAFDFLITVDKNIPFQQNLNLTKFTILLLDAPRTTLPYVLYFAPKLLSVLENPPEQFYKLIHFSYEGWQNDRLISKLKKRLSEDEILFL